MGSYVKRTEEYPPNGRTLLGRLDMELTERCNNNCIHCYINLPFDDPCKARELSAEKIKAILMEAVDLGCLTVRFTGGEPLLRDDFQEIYLFARKLGLKVLLFTNATLITPELADLFARIPPRKKIEVSVYGMSKKSYEAVTRTPGSFHAAKRGIALLQERGIPFVVKAAVLSPNKGELDEFEAWAVTIPGMEKPPAYSCFFDLRARPGSEEKNDQIRQLRATPEDGIKIISRDRERYLAEMRQFCTRFMKSSGDRLFSCGAGHGACVDAYGFVQPCMLLRDKEAVYDLRKGTLREALTEFFPKIRGIKSQNSDYLSRCGRCFLKGLCEQCPGKSWMEHGTLDTPVEYLCQVAHVRALDLGLLREGEKAWAVEDWTKRISAFEDEGMNSEKLK
jgi:radical SAM protein with 4Fe4S-binding SPASM domain